jgi:hypothetical protein
MPNHMTKHLPLVALALLSLATPVLADQVILKDGRTFDGQIIDNTKDSVRIDSMVVGIRTKISFKKTDVEKINFAALPADFYSPPANQLPGAASNTNPDDNLFLQIPIVGTIGKDVMGSGVERALSYAKGKGVKYIVLYFDSPGGSIDETARILRAFDKYNDDFTFVCIVKKCIGEAFALALMSDKGFLRPNAQVGGTSEEFTKLSVGLDSSTEATLRGTIADRVAQQASENGRYPLIVRAMVDPREVTAAWVNNDKLIELGAAVPKGIDKSRIIFENSDPAHPKVLTLTPDQFDQIGLKSFVGNPSDLGSVLNVKNWKEESNFGDKVMAATAKAAAEEKDAQKHAQDTRVERNVSRRAEAEAYISNNMKQAAAWDPNAGSYRSYASRWGWGSYYGGLTRDSRAEWSARTDTATGYLQRAANGIRTMMTLDNEAKTLGLDQTYKPGELQMMLDDITVKINMLQQFRNKTGR